MRQTLKLKQSVSIGLLLAVLAAACLACYLGYIHNFGDSAVKEENPTSLSTGWSIEEAGKREELFQFPGGLTAKQDLRLYRRLPETLPVGAVLCVETNHQILRVSIDGSPVYDLGAEEYRATGEVLGNKWHLVPLSISDGGKELEVEMICPFASIALPVYPILLGSRSSVILNLLKSNMPLLAFGLIALILAVFLMAFAFLIKRNGYQLNAAGSVYLGVFVLLATVWILTDAKILQFFIRNTALLYYISFFSFMLMPIPFLLFAKEMYTHGRKTMYALSGLFLVNFFICLTLYLAGVIVMPQVIYSTHLLILTAVVTLGILCYREVYHYGKKDLRYILWGMLLLFLSGLLSLVQFYMKNQGGNNSAIFRYGLMLFLILLSCSAIRRSLSLYKSASESRLYKRLAFVDSLTSLHNRAAFNRDMAQLEGSYPKHSPVGFLILDLNKLKTINDTMGHSCGDIAITSAANCISRAFDGIGTCYRIGGDEFVVLTLDHNKEELIQAVNVLRSYIDAYNQDAYVKIDLAWGHAYSLEEPDASCACDLFDIADARMYIQKQTK